MTKNWRKEKEADMQVPQNITCPCCVPKGAHVYWENTYSVACEALAKSCHREESWAFKFYQVQYVYLIPCKTPLQRIMRYLKNTCIGILPILYMKFKFDISFIGFLTTLRVRRHIRKIICPWRKCWTTQQVQKLKQTEQGRWGLHCRMGNTRSV